VNLPPGRPRRSGLHGEGQDIVRRRRGRVTKRARVDSFDSRSGGSEEARLHDLDDDPTHEEDSELGENHGNQLFHA
jgi:hypothetical protein